MAEYIDKIGAADLEGGVGTSVAADGLWNAKGDLAVATADNTATRLGVGTNGQVLIADSAEATGVKWGAGTATTLPGLSDVDDDITTDAANRASYAPNTLTPLDPGNFRIRYDQNTAAWNAQRLPVIDFMDYDPYLDGTGKARNTAKFNTMIQDLEARGGGRIKMPGGYLKFAPGVCGLPAHSWLDGEGMWTGNPDAPGNSSGLAYIGTHLYYDEASHFLRLKSYGTTGTAKTITGVTYAAGTTTTGSLATITAVAHGFAADDEVKISGVLGATGVNGTWRVVSVPTADTFTIRCASPGTWSAGGTQQAIECADYEADMVRISNMTIRGGTDAVSGSYDAIRFRNAPGSGGVVHSYTDDTNHWIDSVLVSNWGGRGIYMLGSGTPTWSRGNRVTNSHLISCGKYTATPVPGIEYNSSSDGVVVNCVVESTGGSTTTYLAGCDGVKMGGGNGGVFITKSFYSRGNGITLASSRCHAYSCEAQDNMGHGVELGADDPIVFGFRSDSNGSTDAGQPGPWFGVYVSTAASGGTVHATVGNRGTVGETDYGIGFSAANTSRDLVVSIALGLQPKPLLCRPSDYAQLGRQFVDGMTRRVMQQTDLTYNGNGTVVTSGVDLTARYVYEGQYRVEATIITDKLNTSSPDPAVRLECVEDTFDAPTVTGTFTVNALSGFCLETGAAATGMAWTALTGSPTPLNLASGATTELRVFRLRGVVNITSVRTDVNGTVGGIVRVAFGSNGNASTNTVTLEAGSELLLERIL